MAEGTSLLTRRTSDSTVGSNPTLSAKQENEMSKDCGCGRSPNGKCGGWHNLTNEQYEAKKVEHEKKLLNESIPQFLKE